MVKMNKMQLEAVVKKIKIDAQKLIDADVENLRKLFKMTPEQQEIYNDAVNMEAIMDAYNIKYPSKTTYGNTVNWYRGYTSEQLVTRWENEWVNENKINFDFTTLEADLIIEAMGADNINTLIENALITYRVND